MSESLAERMHGEEGQTNMGRDAGVKETEKDHADSDATCPQGLDSIPFRKASAISDV